MKFGKKKKELSWFLEFTLRIGTDNSHKKWELHNIGNPTQQHFATTHSRYFEWQGRRSYKYRMENGLCPLWERWPSARCLFSRQKFAKRQHWLNFLGNFSFLPKFLPNIMHFHFFWGCMLPTGYTCNGPIQNYLQLSQNLCGGRLATVATLQNWKKNTKWEGSKPGPEFPKHYWRSLASVTNL